MSIQRSAVVVEAEGTMTLTAIGDGRFGSQELASDIRELLALLVPLPGGHVGEDIVQRSEPSGLIDLSRGRRGVSSALSTRPRSDSLGSRRDHAVRPSSAAQRT